MYSDPQVTSSGVTSEGLPYFDYSSGATSVGVRPQPTFETVGLESLAGGITNSDGVSGSGLAIRFGHGLWGAVKGATVEPVLQVRDMGLALASVTYNELLRKDGDAMWLPEMKSGTAEAYANGASQTRLLLQSNFITGTGVLTHDLTTSTMNGDWGSVAEQLGGVAGGFAIGKATSKYGGYGLALDDIGATGPLALQRGSIGLKLVVPDSSSPAGIYSEGNTIVRIGEQGQTTSFFAKITADDLGTGTTTNASSRSFARSLGFETDDAGHFGGRQLGGYGGSTSGNIFPQAPNINRGAFAQFEGQVAGAIQDHGFGFIRVVPEYSLTSPTRPIGLTYQVRIGGQTYNRVFGN
jgi:hypothetical protein